MATSYSHGVGGDGGGGGDHHRGGGLHTLVCTHTHNTQEHHERVYTITS